jgi:O-antigen/teichoic acid export membrane protein
MSVALLGSVTGGALGFFFFVVMARLLEQREFGLLVLAANLLITCTAVTIAGADYAAIRYVASARTAGAKRGAMLAPIKLVMTLNICLALAITLLAAPISKHVLDEPRFEDVLRAAAIALPLTVLAQMFSACLSGLEQARGELVRKVVEQGGRIAAGTLAVSLGLGVVGATLGMAIAAAGAAIAVGFVLLRSLPRGGAIEPLPAKAVVAFAWPQGIANMATQVWSFTVIGIVSHSSDTRTVALFGAAFAIAQLPLLIYNAFTYRFSPTIARLSSQHDADAVADLVKSVTRWIAIFALPLYAVAITLPGPLLQIYGSTYRDAAFALAVMAIATLVNTLAGPGERVLIMTGHVKLVMVINVLATTALAPLALALIRLYGLSGAAISVLIYAIARNAARSYVVHRTMRSSTLSRALLRPLGAATVASGAAFVVDNLTNLGSSLLGTLALAMMLVTVYGFVLLRLVGIPEADRETLRLATGRATPPSAESTVSSYSA